METQELINSLNQQHALGTLRRNMEIMLWLKAGKMSQSDIARKYHLSRERVSQIVRVWTEFFEALHNGDFGVTGGKNGNGNA